MYWLNTNTNKIYYNKMMALKDSSSSLVFRVDESLDTYNWKKEPTESWDELLKQRALEIREKYGFVRLWYSGGSDSHTILNTFLKHNIHLDEIAMCRMSPINNFTGMSCIEINLVAIPFVRSIQHTIPKTRIKIYDFGFEQFKQHYTNKDILKYNNLEFRVMYPTNKHFYYPNINKTSNTINIDGLEKPIVKYDKLGFYHIFSDSIQIQDIRSPSDKIFNIHFFMDPKIYCKQCYLIINAFLEGKITDLNCKHSINKICRDNLYINIHLKKRSSNTHSVKNLISMKESYNNSETKFMYNTYIDIFKGIGIDKIYFNDPKDLTFGFKSLETKKYYLD